MTLAETVDSVVSANFTGTWKLERQLNFNAFLQAAGVNRLLRTIAATDRPVMRIIHDGDHFLWHHREAKRSQTIDAVIDSGNSVPCRSPVRPARAIDFPTQSRLVMTCFCVLSTWCDVLDGGGGQMGEHMDVTFAWEREDDADGGGDGGGGGGGVAAALDRAMANSGGERRLREEQRNVRDPRRSVSAVRWLERDDGGETLLVHELRLPGGAWVRRYYRRQPAE